MSGFNRPEALRSFRKGAELDPRRHSAMGHRDALGPYINVDMDPDLHEKRLLRCGQS